MTLPPLPTLYSDPVVRATIDNGRFLQVIDRRDNLITFYEEYVRVFSASSITLPDDEAQSSVVLGGFFGRVTPTDLDQPEIDELRLGPYPTDVAAALVQALVKHLGLPRSTTPRQVDDQRLRQDPAAYDGQLIQCQGWWDKSHFETSEFVGASLQYPLLYPPCGMYYIKVTGLWICAPGGVYGHLGAHPAALEVHTQEMVHVSDPPVVHHQR